MSAARPSVLGIIAVGGAAGLLSGLFGVGGGLVLVPGMVLALGLSQHQAHASSLAAIVVTAPAALAGFAIAGNVALAEAALISAGAVVGAVAGADAMRRLSEARLRQAFALFILLIAVRLIVGAVTGSDIDAVPPDLSWLVGIGYATLGVGSGLLAALMGVGGGIILVPALVLLFSFDQHLAEGTSLAIIIPTALVAAWRHGRSGYTDWPMGLKLGGASVVAALIGAQLALALDPDVLQAIFAVFLVLVAIRMLLSERRPKA